MSDKKLSLLGVAAVVSVVLAVFVAKYANRVQPASMGQGYLIQGLDPEKIAQIEIKREGATITLQKRGSGFVLAQKAYYPALNKEINELITACTDIQTVELYTKDKANHKDLGVAEDNAYSTVKFLDSKGELITGIVVGQMREGGMSYARLINSDEVYVVNQVPWIKTEPMDYIETKLAALDKADIASVTVKSPDGAYTLTAKDDGAVLNELPEGKQQTKDCDMVFGLLTNLRFDDVNSVVDMADLKFDRQYTCLLKDSTLYTISIAKKDSKTFARCEADFTDKAPVKKEQGVESEEELKKKEAKLLAKEKVVDFNKACQGWVYVIPEYKAENLVKPLSELIEDIPAATEPESTTTKAAEEL